MAPSEVLLQRDTLHDAGGGCLFSPGCCKALPVGRGQAVFLQLPGSEEAHFLFPDNPASADISRVCSLNFQGQLKAPSILEDGKAVRNVSGRLVCPTGVRQARPSNLNTLNPTIHHITARRLARFSIHANADRPGFRQAGIACFSEFMKQIAAVTMQLLCSALHFAAFPVKPARLQIFDSELELVPESFSYRGLASEDQESSKLDMLTTSYTRRRLSGKVQKPHQPFIWCRLTCRRESTIPGMFHNHPVSFPSKPLQQALLCSQSCRAVLACSVQQVCLHQQGLRQAGAQP